MDESLKKYIVPSRFIESQHPVIIAKAEELTRDVIQVEDKVRNIFYFIRDHIRYSFIVKFDEKEYFASNILKKARGFCTQKAILFCALARSCNIPAGIHFFDIVDHTMPDRIVTIMGTRMLYHHGIGELYMDGSWYKYDATLDIHITTKNHLYPVNFIPKRNCLMNDKTISGDKHIEYKKDHGLHSDISFNELISWFRKGYPHLFEKYAS